MFVKSVMIPVNKAIYIEKGKTIQDALDILISNNIDGMPIVDRGKYIGLVTLNRIYESYFKSDVSKDIFLNETRVEDIKFKEDHVVSEQQVFEQLLLMVKTIPLVAVVNDDGIMVGIITRYDVLEQFQSAFGMKTKGVRISFTSSESEGRISRLADIAKQFQRNIISLTTFDESDKLVRRIVIKVDNHPEKIPKFIEKLESSGFRILSIKEQ